MAYENYIQNSNMSAYNVRLEHSRARSLTGLLWPLLRHKG